MKYKHKQEKSLIRYFLGLFFVITLLFIVATSNTKTTVIATNVNTVKAIESSRIVTPINMEELYEEVEYIKVFNTNEITLNKGNLIEFVGTITGYGPDCEGCSGIVGCPPYQNVLNNNIYYDDKEYGTIRILAADPSIPCGSIIKVSNYDNTEFIGIVLDRGRDIKGLTMDLLFDSENTTFDLGRKYNINFKIERWGF